MKNILIVASHADDEILGCGGTMAKHIENGDLVFSLILCPERKDQSINSTKVIGHRVSFGHYNDQFFDTYPLLSITRKIEDIIADLKPQIVFTHWHSDLNLDHSLTARATLTACRPLPGSTVEAIYGFEIPSSTEWGVNAFHPTHYEELSDAQFDKKMDALECYKGEIKDYPHARSMASIVALSTKRGCEVGVKQAEAFYTYRTINKSSYQTEKYNVIRGDA